MEDLLGPLDSAEVMRRISAARRAAQAVASAELAARGFSLDPSGAWCATWDIEGRSLPVVIRLPQTFPAALPEITVDREQINGPVSHVVGPGGLCLAPTTGVYLDAARPRVIIRDALERAHATLRAGLRGENAVDRVEEFEAYWGRGKEAIAMWSVVPNLEKARPIHLGRVLGGSAHYPGTLSHGVQVFADSRAELRHWAERLGAAVLEQRPAYFLPLDSAFLPPDDQQPFSMAELLAVVHKHASKRNHGGVMRWLGVGRWPAAILLAMPALRSGERILCGVELGAASWAEPLRARDGFRRGPMAASYLLSRLGAAPATRIRVFRFDREYLIGRGGGMLDLGQACVAVVGCGAVGSHVAQHLGALGVGRLLLIDHETLAPGNVHRHVLGVADVGRAKATAMADTLQGRWPHLDVTARHSDVQDILADDAEALLQADLIIVALGDPTIEMVLNRALAGGPPRLHVWVEPLGVGGHALLTDTHKAAGCFECLIEPDDTHGQVNMAAFVAPGQEIARTMAGCAGHFFPFSILEADRAAIEAVHLGARILAAQEAGPLLVSWRGDPSAFLAEGFRLSRRADQVAIQQTYRRRNLARPDCATCAPRTGASPAPPAAPR